MEDCKRQTVFQHGVLFPAGFFYLPKELLKQRTEKCIYVAVPEEDTCRQDHLECEEWLLHVTAQRCKGLSIFFTV